MHERSAEAALKAFQQTVKVFKCDDKIAGLVYRPMSPQPQRSRSYRVDLYELRKSPQQPLLISCCASVILVKEFLDGRITHAAGDYFYQCYERAMESPLKGTNGRHNRR